MKLIDILVEELPKRGGWRHGVKTMTQDKWKDIWGYNCCQPWLKHSGWWVSKSGADLVNNSKIKVTELAIDWQTAIITREQYEAALSAKNDGWIEWGGGECPVHVGTLVDVKWRDGRIDDGIPAKISHDLESCRRNAISWRHHGRSHDIIAYRLHKPQEATQADDETDLNECIGQDVAPVWSGDGLPPAGCECEYQYKVHGSEWFPLECVAVDGKAVFGWSNNTPVALQSNTHNFRPTRSEADKKRDEAKHAIAELCRSSASNGHSADLIYDAIAAGKVPGIKLEV